MVKFRDLLFTSKFSRIIYSQPESLAHRPNTCFEKIKKTFLTAELINGLPNVSKLNLDLNNLPTLLIIDDQMTTLLDSSAMVDLLTVKVHHFNITTVFTLQVKKKSTPKITSFKAYYTNAKFSCFCVFMFS